MTSAASTAAQDQAEARASARTITWTVVRVTVSVAALLALYYLLPLDRSSTLAAVTILIIGLIGFIALVAFHARSIIRSRSRGCGPSRPWL